MLVSRMLGVALVAALAAPATATASSIYGGKNRRIDTKSEAKRALRAASETHDFSVLGKHLSRKERRYFATVALLPTTTNEGVGPATGRLTSAGAHAAKRRHYAERVWCETQNSWGETLFFYNSEWTWIAGGKRVFDARHVEYPSDVAWWWEFDGSRYLLGSGGLKQAYIGRETEGEFKLNFGLQGLGLSQSVYKRLDVHVHGDGHLWQECAG